MASTNFMRKGKSVREVFVNFAEMCSMQGIPYIHAATFWWSRLIWVVLTLTAIGALIFHLYYIMSQYYDYPVQTKSERRKRFADGNSEINITNYDEYYYDESYYYEDEYGDKNENGYVIDQLFKYTYMDLPRDVRKDAGHFMSDMIVSCSFAGRECTAKAFTLHQTADYGNCWELNTTNMVSKRSGDIGGLIITLNLENWEILEGVSQGYGARLVVHEPGTIPFPSTEGIFISSFFETNIGLRMVAVSRLGEPYSHCDDGKTFRERYGVTYTRQSCQFICLTSTVIRICGCYEDSGEELVMMVDGTTHRCQTKTEIRCYSKVFQDYRDKEISCDCLNPCNENGYVKTISSRPWPTEKYAAILASDKCCFESANECALIRFLSCEAHYKELCFYMLKNLHIHAYKLHYLPKYVSRTTKYIVAMFAVLFQFAQFMSDVGGAIGLWIGLSVLALCEIFHLILELCALGINVFCLKGQSQHSSQGDIERAKDGKMMDTENRHQEQTDQNRAQFQEHTFT
ncbi:hypothetical protein ACJMK2_042396 [Sinanodonta woodiana]|uniref:Uncharacterized protein n=1 Tax=Sinanodonta woodiana TaxID=1069815 RepID=A0ABD3WB07_SINWO